MSVGQIHPSFVKPGTLWASLTDDITVTASIFDIQSVVTGFDHPFSERVDVGHIWVREQSWKDLECLSRVHCAVWAENESDGP